jgi:type IV secretory pathway TrbF-like protein
MRAGAGNDNSERPPFSRYTKYYEQNGLLRAYANRVMYLCVFSLALAFCAFGVVLYVEGQPPTVIRVDKDGNAAVVGGSRRAIVSGLQSAQLDPSAGAPTDLEGRAIVRRFLNRYLSYTPDSVDQNLAEAVNMMTANLRQFTMTKLSDQDTVGKIRADHIISDFRVHAIERAKDSPWTYTVFGVKEVHRVKAGTEVTDQIIGRYSIRLVETLKSEANPSGLLVAEYGEQQMVGRHEGGLLQQSDLDKTRN